MKGYKHMEKLHFSIVINAPKEKVWHTMLDDATYRQWTEVFAPGSYYVGDWNKGSKILFLDPVQKTGMVSRIAENRPYALISIEHLGIVEDGKEYTTGEKVKGRSGAYENYTFKEIGGNTEVLVDMDTMEEYKEMFEQKWPEALQKLKDIAEGSAPRR
jgi:L-rhamnose mutarotase